MAGRPSELMYVETPLLEQLKSLGWTVVQLNDSEKHDPEKSFRKSFSEVIIESHLKDALKRLNPWLNDVQVDDLCTQVQNYPFPLSHTLENNEEVYDRITEGLSADNEDTGETNCPVRLIDWTDVDAYDGPDITEPMAEGIDQLLRYQNCRDAKEPEGVAELFYYNQIVISTCFHDCRYSSITGGMSHFMEWKDAYPYKLRDINPNGKPSAQEITVVGMLEPSHLLDIVQNYIAYKDEDNGTCVKLVPRYMQYRSASKIIERLRKEANGEKGGTLWHTQGSGKTLTMMFVIRKMYNSYDLNSYKVVLIVDRKDLQTQMFKTTKTVKYTVNTAESIDGLKKLIANTASDVTVAMVHKFGEPDKDKNEKDRAKSASLHQRQAVSTFPVLNTSGRILVMIDEAHRSEYSELAANMWKSMPNSVKVAFTGTPITKTVDNFGGYIDTYTMKQAEEDGIVVEIKYEGRATDSEITDHDAMNHAFIDVFGYLEDEEQLEILGKYTVRGYLEAQEVIDEKASDMLDHYINTVFANGFKAQIVGVSKEAAYRYKMAIDRLLPGKIAELERHNPNKIDIEQLKKIKTACIISSGGANEDQHLKQYTNESTNELIIDGFKAPFGETGLKGGDGNYGILIVTAMLLTGFDAPVEQVMYLDKKLTNHNLLQAITRVNRTCGADKKCGYLVDYVGITNHLRDALADYADADRDEIMASLCDKSKDIDALNTAYNEIIQFLNDKVGYALTQTSDIIEELCVEEELREEYNGRFSVMSRLFDRVLPNPAALEYSDDYKTLAFIRESVAKMTRNPRFSNKDASKKIRAIIEEYLTVNGVDMEIEPISLLSDEFLKCGEKKKSDRAASEEIKYAVREFININMPKDPELYARLSERLEQILEEFKNNWSELRKALEQLRRNIKSGRAKEENYGYDATHEMPFLAMLRTEFYGKKTFEELTEDQMSVLKNLTDDVLSRFKVETTAVNFWNNITLQQELRTNIIKRLIEPDVRRCVPDIFRRRKDVAQKLMELGYQHFGGDV
ncbi:MAG: HsdR family type I site-specific deoxyribonuclease [Clostridiales bacterium]|nr:HsdR family type I site-specific deoxyribonuclease [Clostridiales bacterium]